VKRTTIIPNGSEETKGSKCHGCESFEVLVTHSKRLGDSERYWCNKLRSRVNPWRVICPKEEK